LCKGSDGKLYIGTSYGVSVMDLATHQIINQLGSHDAIKSFANPNVIQLYEDSRKLLWIATIEGLYVYDRSKDKLQTIYDKNDAHDRFVLGIIEDKQGDMWVSVGATLYRVGVSTTKDGGYAFAYNNYRQSDGVQNSDFNQRSFHRLSTGEILVGGLYGVNTFMPKLIRYSSKAPRVTFADLSLQDEIVNVGQEYDGRVVLESELNCGEAVNLSYKHNDFTVYFAADNFIDPEETQFYYRLVGFNNEWVKCAPGMHQATYTNLPYGEYQLEVKAINNDGTESESVSSLTIVVHPPFWLTIWAKIIYVILAIAVIFLIFRAIKRREQKKYQEQQKEESIKQQEELTQMKFRFFTNISHELRTPLTLILSPLQALLKDITDDKQHHRLELIHGNANRLLYLVNQLLDFRKNEIAGLKYRPEEGDVVAYVKNLCDSFDGFLEGKNVQLTFFSSSDSLKMSYDPDKLGKIVLNLLSNAFKFTPDGGRVDVALTRSADNLVIKVADTGIGIDDKDKPLIFERFYQTDTSKSGGSGIGLSLVSEYVKLHSGTAKVVDNIGGGSVFIITIPIRHVELASGKKVEPVAEEVDIQVETQADDNRPLALIVDDNADLLTFLSEEISSHCNVMTATNGREALELIDQRIPDIIVTDLMMPVMDGIELCRQLKSDKKYASIPIIVLSAKHDDHAKVEGLTIGADDYITKPFNCDVLMLRINKLLELSRKGVQRSLIDPEPTPIKVTSLDEKLIESAVKYVEENMERADLSVEELSRHLGMSRVHLYKRMRQVTGKTPIEFIRVLRLKRAAQLLRESQLNVSEIAYQVGFNNPKYFSTYFKEEFGVLPSVYQEKEGK
jgi:signal transduction histidine kinase/DNA-binding response OmpR family regulator